MQSLTKDYQVVESFIEDEESREGQKEAENVEENRSIAEGNESVVTEEVDKYGSAAGELLCEGVDSGILKGIGRGTSQSGRDWWWKQDNVNGGSDSGRIKDCSDGMDCWERRSSQDFASGDIPKSGGVSGTPSMRAVCLSLQEVWRWRTALREMRCTVLVFLLLVLVSGRRPLQVTASPMSEFERANLVSWARQLAHSGKLLDLVDPNIQLLDREQALLCITIALLSIYRDPPNKRPTMKEIVGMLCGDSSRPLAI
ncbi:hypothetical protein HAX54_044400 [Datura stramonium]|uniref:Uncharacterized protein n=1 Tax=Datura stramonium TaxID=4076 RepID=A0ABS8SPI9_DATST|nr:hypothetical protein [Datura stramonium]